MKLNLLILDYKHYEKHCNSNINYVPDITTQNQLNEWLKQQYKKSIYITASVSRPFL